MADKALDYEFNRYIKELPNILDKEGKYVLVYKDEPFDFFTSLDDALKTGYERHSLEPFLVQLVALNPIPLNFTRDLGVSCRA